MKSFTPDFHNRLSKIVQKQKFVKEIFEMIFEKGGKVLLVGGAVRDLLLEKDCYDLDFEVYGITIEQLQNILARHGKVKLVGKSFGVLRLYGLDIDWSLPRKDGSGRHPQVEYDPDLSYEQAFIRRDLTINAMGIDMQTYELIDLYGGLHDLQHKNLKAPDLDFFVQDPLRFYRVMQFCSRFEMSVDEALSKECLKMDLTEVSVERIYQEFKKMFTLSDCPACGLQWIDSIGRFKELIGCTPSALLFDQLNSYASKKNTQKLIGLWVIMAHHAVPFDVGKHCKITRDYIALAANFIKGFHNDKNVIKQIIMISWAMKLIKQKSDDVTLHWIAQWISPNASFIDLINIMNVVYEKDFADNITSRVIELGIDEKPLKPLLTGKDFLQEGFVGREIGDLVRKSLELQITQKYTDKDLLKDTVLANYITPSK